MNNEHAEATVTCKDDYNNITLVVKLRGNDNMLIAIAATRVVDMLRNWAEENEPADDSD